MLNLVIMLNCWGEGGSAPYYLTIIIIIIIIKLLMWSAVVKTVIKRLYLHEEI
jgi:hypothetical protein